MDAIVHVGRNWGIGKDNRLLIHIREDLRRFRSMTEGSTIVLGRRTLQSFPDARPLPDRRHVVLSRNPDFRCPGVCVCSSVRELFECLAETPEPIFVVGGESVYRLLLPYCRSAHVTRSDVALPADTFFPDLDHTEGWYLNDPGVWLEGLGRTTSGTIAVRYRFTEYRQACPRGLPRRTDGE